MGKVFKSVGKVLGFRAPKAPQIVMPKAPPAQQEARAADYNSALRRNQKNAMGSTTLTSPGGADPTAGALGRNVLLGS